MSSNIVKHNENDNFFRKTSQNCNSHITPATTPNTITITTTTPTTTPNTITTITITITTTTNTTHYSYC